jgi:hypothetical protein
VRAVGGFLFVFIFLALLYGRPIIQNDGITYYALTYSLIEDHDFDLTNQATLFRDLRVFPSSNTGRIASIYSCGFAFLYAPIVLVARFFSPFLAVRPYAQNITFPFSDAIGVFVGSIMFGLFSIFIAYRMLVNQGLDRVTAFIISFIIFCGTPLIFYTFTTPSFSHAADAFLVSTIFYLAIRKEVRFRYVLLGFSLGLSVLLRNVNFSLIVPIVIGSLYFERFKGKKHILTSFGEVVVGGLPVLLILLYYNLSQYGSLIATGYPVPFPDEGSEFPQMFLSFERMILYPSQGLFIWSPITVLAISGLIIGCKKGKRESVLAIISVIIVIGTMCFFRIMYPGATFGNRLLSHLYIFWVLGLYEIYVALPKTVMIASAICLLWSFLLFNAYYINFASPESRKILSDVQNVSPIKVLQTAVKTYKGDQSASNPIQFWYRSLRSAPYPSLHALIWHPESRYQPKRKRFQNE